MQSGLSDSSIFENFCFALRLPVGQCEEVTSTDHSPYEGGENVTVTKYD